jgi:hypothetical protein
MILLACDGQHKREGNTVKIVWGQTTNKPPQYDDYCPDCGQYMNSFNVTNGVARCYACHVSNKKR